jgi:hypothetical protein
MRWKWIIAGRVPLALAWFVAFLASIGVIQLVANTLAGTFLDTSVFWGLILLPSLAIPVIAWRKRRRLLVWGGIAVGLFGIGVLQPFFQPLTGLLAIVLASPGPVPPPPPDPAEVAARNEQMILDLHQVAERLGAFPMSADALLGSEELETYETEISSIRGDVIRIPQSDEDMLTRIRALTAGSVNRWQSAVNKAILLAGHIGKHRAAIEAQSGKPYKKLLKDMAVMREELNLASAYLDEAKVHLSAVEAERRAGPGKLPAPARDPGPGDLRGQRARPERGRRKPRY